MPFYTNMNILVIDNNINRIDWGSNALRRALSLQSGITIETRRGPERDLPRDLDRFQRIVVSGSKTSCLAEEEWVNELETLMTIAMEKRIPLIGVCYGHQILARILGTNSVLGKGKEPEFGWVKIKKTAESVIFNSLPKEFFSFGAHYEAVIKAPSSVRVLATSDRCSIQAFEVKDIPAWGMQFHPEVALDGAKKRFDECRLNKSPKVLLHENESEKLYDSKIGETIFTNFLGDL